MKADELRLGYMLITTPYPNVYLGGAMVTDGRGLPVEFRYTEPIQPTKIQQVLYGQVLSKYIKREVILDTLFKSLDTKFKMLMVEDDSLLEMDGKGLQVIRISETKTPKIGSVGDVQELSESEVLLQTSRDGSPVRLQLGLGTNTESPALPSAGTQGRFDFNLLVQAGQTMDLYEPLKRIEKALEIICQEAGVQETA